MFPFFSRSKMSDATEVNPAPAKPQELHPLDVLTGFVSKDGEAYGRPVGVAVDGRGALLVADDVGNTIWRVTRK